MTRDGTISEQQQQTLTFFNRDAAHWDQKAKGMAGPRVNVSAQRNQCVLDVLAERAPGRFVDIGCGSGQLAIDAAAAGWTCEGLDFAPDMIELCRANAAEAGSAATFRVASALEDGGLAGADVFSAMGFIEYVSLDELRGLLDRTRALLPDDGLLVLGSRNRLFNLSSMNAFTDMERNLGTQDALLSESIAFRQSATWQEALDAARTPLLTQPDAHPHHAVEVTTRYQYTPSELVGLMNGHGFAPHALFGVNYHGVPANLDDVTTATRVELADAVFANRRRDHRFLPWSSTFVLAARRI